MSASITIDGQADNSNGDGGQQQSRRQEPAIAIEEAVPGTSDADVVREAREALERANSQRDDANRTAAAATSEAGRLRNEAARMAAGRVQDQRATLASAIEAADNELKAARTAYKMAFDAGDADGQITASETIASARYRKDSATGQLAMLPEGGNGQQQQQPMRQPEQTPQPVARPGNRSQAWLDAHPRFNTDPNYKAMAITAHNQAVGNGYAPETDQYFSHINRVMDAAYGDGHANGGSVNGGHQMNGGGNQNGGGHTSSAGASNRGGGGSGDGYRALRTDLGVFEVTTRRDGTMRVKKPEGQMLENMDEGAKICFPTEYAKDQRAATDQYITEQVKIALERESGGNAGLVPMGEGRTWR